MAAHFRSSFPGVRAMKRMHLPLAIGAAMAIAQLAPAQEVALRPENRIDLVNIGHVFTKYEKATALKAEMEKTLQPFKDQAEKIKAEVAELKAQLSDATTIPADKTKLEQALIVAKRKLEDVDRD